MANPRTAFEVALMVQRVAARAASYFGRDWREPPEDLLPYELWSEAVKLFPPSVRRELDDPDEDEEGDRDEITVKLMTEVPLSEDSGISLAAIRRIVSDDDGDGPYTVDTAKLDYTLWVGNRDWTGDSVAMLRAHLQGFENTLKERDPIGLAKFLGQ